MRRSDLPVPATGVIATHFVELRCYLRDPDGRIIEVGQSTGFLEDLED